MIKLRAVLRRRWPLVVFGLVVGALAGAASSAMVPEEGETRYSVSQLVVANAAAGRVVSVEQDALRVTRGDVAVRAADALGVNDPQAAAGGVRATADIDSGSIEIVATSTDPDYATRRVEAFVASFLEVVNGDLLADQQGRLSELESQVTAAEQDLAAFDEQNPELSLAAVGGNQVVLDQLVSERAELESQLQSVQDQFRTERLNAKATLPYSTLGADAPDVVDDDLLPVPTSVPFRATLLGLVGLLLAIGAVMLIERLIPRIDTRAELAALAEHPVISEVGNFPPKAQPHARDGTLALDGAWAEPYRRIRSAIQFVQARSAAAPDHDPQNVFLIASPSPSDGKSTTAALTGLALAETGQLTLVIGGDFRRPKVHELLGATAHPGIRDYAQLAMERPSAAQVVKATSHSHLHVAAAGSPGKEIAGLPEAVRDISSQAAEQGATVIIDSSPIEVANDTIDLLPATDAVIMLVRSGNTTVRTLHHSLEVLEQHGANVIGMVLIGAPGIGKRQYYYEGYYTSQDPTEPWRPDPPEPSGSPEDSRQQAHGDGHDDTRGQPPSAVVTNGAQTPPPFAPGATPAGSGVSSGSSSAGQMSTRPMSTGSMPTGPPSAGPIAPAADPPPGVVPPRWASPEDPAQHLGVASPELGP